MAKGPHGSQQPSTYVCERHACVCFARFGFSFISFVNLGVFSQDVNDDGTFYLVYEDGDVEERVERVNIRHASPDPNVLTDAIESALEMESALRAKWTVHREEKREQDATLHPAHLTPGMHVAANANYGRGMVRG